MHLQPSLSRPSRPPDSDWSRDPFRATVPTPWAGHCTTGRKKQLQSGPFKTRADRAGFGWILPSTLQFCRHTQVRIEAKALSFTAPPRGDPKVGCDPLKVRRSRERCLMHFNTWPLFRIPPSGSPFSAPALEGSDTRSIRRSRRGSQASSFRLASTAKLPTKILRFWSLSQRGS
jgi:hypothetical protein